MPTVQRFTRGVYRDGPGYDGPMLLLFFACTSPTDTADKPGDTDTVQACSDDDACAPYGICQADVCVDGDRNNDIDEAETLLWEESKNGVLNPEGDVDFYAFSAEGGEFVRVKSVLDNPDDEDYDTVVVLRDPNGKAVATGDGYPTGGSISNADAVIYAYLASAGTYTIAVQDAADYYGDGSTGERDYGYSILVEEWSQHTSEDGGSYDIAPETANSWNAIGVLFEEDDDLDMVSIDFPWDNASITIAGAVDLGNSEANVLAELDDGDDVITRREDLGPGGYAIHPSLDSGMYHLTLSDSAGSGDDHWFFVFIKMDEADSAYPEEVEDNNTRGDATPLAFDEKTTSDDKLYSYAHIWGDADGGGDDDWFTIDAPYAPSYVVVCAQADAYGSGVIPELELYDGDGTLVGSSADFAGGGPDARVENLELDAGGTLRVRSDGSGLDDWYEAIVYVASFSVDSYEEGGYSCP